MDIWLCRIPGMHGMLFNGKSSVCLALASAPPDEVDEVDSENYRYDGNLYNL